MVPVISRDYVLDGSHSVGKKSFKDEGAFLSQHRTISESSIQRFELWGCQRVLRYIVKVWLGDKLLPVQAEGSWLTSVEPLLLSA